MAALRLKSPRRAVDGASVEGAAWRHLGTPTLGPPRGLRVRRVEDVSGRNLGDTDFFMDESDGARVLRDAGR